jgi:hypothetical protein
MEYPVILSLALGGVLLFVVIVYAVTGSVLAVFMVLALAGVLLYVLSLYGYVQFNTDQGGGVDIKFFETAPKPSSAKTVLPGGGSGIGSPIEKKEVFYVSGNNYTYDDAPAVCAAYGADLASYDQVNEAYSGGAEWCGYGWTQGGMALFPTQQDTWDALQGEVDIAKRTGCGRPGVNGGYFNPATKFGVNCYGVKPKDGSNSKYPTPLPGTDAGQFNQMVNKFRSMLTKMTVSPFNRTGWSEWNTTNVVAKVVPK